MAAALQVSAERRRGHFFLLTLDFDARNIHISTFSKTESALASTSQAAGSDVARSGGGANVHRLTAGQGAFVLQGSFVQVINRGEGVAAYLSFYLVSHGMALTVRA